jgi:hypothetical protein
LDVSSAITASLQPELPEAVRGHALLALAVLVYR